ncbi:N-6 DNA methylase [uncultured Kriegella sp.]|uniref:Eco57I restriction-modification methylase domain-containing protein n=1 Tax=uncultured Kriegella sp. TaxID=1798910 RepID=UPI0030DA9C96|tara:strand:+ start:96761 stop:99928 length:3168 start_codon:yes stop_codon:yes gene_type:complete
MPLFQTSVLKKYLSQQDQTAAEKAYRKYSKYFLNTEIQENIRSSKEEQFQATFLTELFVNVFDYTINPSPKYNLTTEYKNEKNNRKADGAILNDATTLAVVELKGTNTKDLESIRRQAFDYKVNHKGCRYVITSNFEKLRFYIDDATAHESFDLFQLTPDRFALLYLCLYKDNLLTGVPFKIKQDSLVKEEQITKEFYNDYSLFKRELFRDLVKRNAKKIRIERQQELKEISTNLTYQQELQGLEKNVKLALFKRSQKLIDRFLFVFFAEDRGLLTPNSTLQILEKWKADMDFGDERPLYNLFKQYFNYLDTGRKGTSSRAEIYAYNGGLFQPDSILDGLEIDDNLLYRHTLKLAKYDFESQVDVNILGHIFENSLNEIESVNAEIEGAQFDKQKSKRKKDGVFYTPKYITKYIVENTIGKLCEEKKAALGFKEEEYFRGRKHRQKATVQKLVDILDEYRDWLLQLTICDPACGSGAFLNQALDFLIKEHQYIDELKAKVLGGGLQFPDIENTILENNIYGVDLNEESVEIAKLSLWLRTAQPRRKLNDLSSNIKCGNSLIDSKAIAGDKAFHWETAFLKVFEYGGFDVVIGNPPYVQSHAINTKTKEYFYKNYQTAEYQVNLYGLFCERIFSIIKDNGLYSFIIPNYWISTKYDDRLRNFLFHRNYCSELINLYRVFEDATVDTLIITGKRTDNPTYPKTTHLHSVNNTLTSINQRLLALDQENWLLSKSLKIGNDSSKINISFNSNIELNGEYTIGDFFDGYQGMKPYEKGKGTPAMTREMMNQRIYHSDRKESENHFPLIGASHVQKYYIRESDTFILYGANLAAPRKLEIFEGPRLLLNRILSKSSIDVTYTEKTLINNTDVFNFIPKTNNEDKIFTVLGILGSSLCAQFFKMNNINLGRKAFPKLNVNHILEFPISDKYLDSSPIKKLLKLSAEKESVRTKLLVYLKNIVGITKLSRKLENWLNLNFGEFIKELNKAIKATNKEGEKEGQQSIAMLTKTDEFEWLDLFEQNKKKAQDLQTQIDAIEQQIDVMVYELYGLTEEEIRIVEHK